MIPSSHVRASAKVGGSGRIAAKGMHKDIKAAYLGKTLGEDKNMELEQFARHILPIRGNGFNARYNTELLLITVCQQESAAHSRFGQTQL